MSDKSRVLKKKAQVSMEYLMVATFAFLMTVPIIGMFYTQSADFKQGVATSQADKILTEIINAADEVYYLGEPSKKTINVYMPDLVQAVTINGDQIRFRVNSRSGDYEIVQRAATNLTGSMKAYEGVHKVIVTAENNRVRIEEE